MAAVKKFCGWKDRPADVEAFVSRLPLPTFNVAAPALMATEHRDILLWEQGEIPLFNRTLPAHAQEIGDCVSHGWSRGVQDAMYIDQAQSRDPNNPKPPQGLLFDGNRWTYHGKQVAGDGEIIEIASEPIYALSRVEIGKGAIGSGDGSVGAWAADAVEKYGCLVRKKYGSVDLTQYDPRIAKAWGMPRAGLPNDLEPEARLHICKYVTMIENGDQARAALYNLYPIPVCSNQGFTMERDSRGMCRPSGSWAHCMLTRGIAMLKGGILVVIIQQSWGENPTGNDTITLEKDGREVKLPQGCFAVDFEVFERRMISAKDSFTLSGPLGFEPRRPLAWNVFNQGA